MLLAIWFVIVEFLFVIDLCFVDCFGFVVDCVVFCCGGVSWWTGACSSLGTWPQHAKSWTKEYGFLHSEALYDSIVFWHSFWIIMHHLTIQCQPSNSVKTLREIWKSCKPMVWGKSVVWSTVLQTQEPILVPHVVGWKPAASNSGQIHSGRSVRESCKQWSAPIRPSI